jgi:alkaline phosphatase D
VLLASANKVNGGKPLTLAVFSCSQYQNGQPKFTAIIEIPVNNLPLLGYFNAYGVAAANASADIFVHLGDYVSPSKRRHCLEH